MSYAKALLCSFQNAYELWIKYDIEKLKISKGGCVIMWWHNRPAKTEERNIEEIIEDLRNEIAKNGFFYYFCKSYEDIIYVFKVKEVIDRRNDLTHDTLPDSWKDCNEYHGDLDLYRMDQESARIFFKTFEITAIPSTAGLSLTDFDFGANGYRQRNLNAVFGFSKKLEKYLATI